MSPFYIFEGGPKEIEKRIEVHTNAKGNSKVCAALSPRKKDRVKVEMLSNFAFGITEEGQDFSGTHIIKAESFLIYDGLEPSCQEIVIYSEKGLKTRDEWWKERDKVISPLIASE